MVVQDDRSVFWTKGVSGAGKSSLALKVAQDFTKKEQSKVSFFFKEVEGERGPQLTIEQLRDLTKRVDELLPAGVDILDDVSFAENGSISDRGESSFAGITLVDQQAQLIEAEQSVIASHEKEISDYISIASNKEDIASQAPRRKTEPELLAVRLFGTFLAELDGLRALQNDLLEKLGTARFIENYRRSLKVYVLKLKEEAQTALEKDTVKVIENRGNRTSIALQFVDHLGPEDIGDRKQFSDLAVQPLKKQLLEEWANNIYGPLDCAPEVVDGSDEESLGEADDLEVNHLKTLTPTNMDKAYSFLQNATPLGSLILQLRLLALPSSLREILESTPKHRIRFSNENDMSLVNQCKAFIETYTMSQWDWWPLRPRVTGLTPA
ncbi:hypothetical protein yc1106_04327 [Curvularia clavata]|uniref:Nephrocystin 3-like N-terminal domain-containing protein n=1 Tax=Curvularia clavata TaxID=95742 RepID=A0A9Q8ZA52_CURCL|nr:hypothetical protein yc1106_04327 [Curvularia clavata]